MLRKICCLLIFSVLSLAFHAFADDKPEVTVPEFNESIKLDGKLNEALWAKVPSHQIAEIEKIGKGEKKIPPGCATSVKIWRTSKALYFGFRCEHPCSPMLKMEKCERDGPVFAGECVELFIFGDFSMRQIVINPYGNLYDSAAKNPNWNGKMRCAAAISRGVWTAELELPFSDLDNAKSILINCTRRVFLEDGIKYAYIAWKNPGHFVPQFKINLSASFPNDQNVKAKSKAKSHNQSGKPQ